jgi:uncharacterized protein YdhG (YjbR/CyaY superfamily)
MAKTDFRSVDEYLATQPAAVRVVLQRVRSTIRKALPSAEEAISYQMPAYKVGGAWVLAFAGWKEHVSLYPVGAAMLEEFGDEVKPYVASKGTLRFPLAEPVPLRLIGRIAKFRAAEAAAQQRAKKKVGSR